MAHANNVNHILGLQKMERAVYNMDVTSCKCLLPMDSAKIVPSIQEQHLMENDVLLMIAIKDRLS